MEPFALPTSGGALEQPAKTMEALEHIGAVTFEVLREQHGE